MALPGNVFMAPGGIHGFDHNARLSPAEAKGSFQQGYRFCLRYLSRTDEGRAANAAKGAPDLAADEAADILNAGLALMAVQHFAGEDWQPSGDLGMEYGQNAARYASAAGLPQGVNVWVDLEAVAANTDPNDVIAYCNNWFSALNAQGFRGGVYVGNSPGRTSQQLFWNLATKHYWRGPDIDTSIPDIDRRGYQLFQHLDKLPNGDEFDRNLTNVDNYGECVYWLSLNALIA
jgi:hypothetical protein